MNRRFAKAIVQGPLDLGLAMALTFIAAIITLASTSTEWARWTAVFFAVVSGVTFLWAVRNRVSELPDE